MPQTKLITFMWVTPWPPLSPQGGHHCPLWGVKLLSQLLLELRSWILARYLYISFQFFFQVGPSLPLTPQGGSLLPPSGGQIAISASVGAMKLKFSRIFVHIILHFFSDWPHPLAPRGVFDAPRGIIAAPLRRSNCYLSFCWSYKTEIWLKTYIFWPKLIFGLTYAHYPAHCGMRRN